MSTGSDWLERVPERWERKKLKHVATLRSGDSITSDDIAEAGDYPVFGGNGIRGYSTRYTHQGDYVLIGRQGALCGNIKYASGFFWASEHAVVVGVRHGTDVTWLGELLRSMDLNRYSQSAAQPGLAVDVLANLEIPVPPTLEQRAIGKYLQGEVGRLDALVRAKERVLGLLAEKRRALITRAVTRGLDPGVRLRGSGIPWLGKIPAHWDVRQLKYVTLSLQTGPFGSQLHAAEYAVGGTPLVNPSHLSGGWIQAEDGVSVDDVTADRLAIHRLRLGDLVFARRGELGRCGIVEPDDVGWLCGTGSLRARLRPQAAEPHYLALVFRQTRIADVLTFQSVGSTMDNLNSDILGSCHVPVPPVAEQHAIVGYLATKALEIDTLHSATERTIGLLKERRAALIAAAVTGQIDVSAVA